MQQTSEGSALIGYKTTAECCEYSPWKVVTHPVVNPLSLTLLSTPLGFCATALVLLLTNLLDGLDCKKDKLGSVELHIILISVFAALYGLDCALGILGAKQRTDHLEKVKDNHTQAMLEFSTAKKESRSITFSKVSSTVDEGDLNDASFEDVTINSSPDAKQSVKAACCPLNPLKVTGISSTGALIFGTVFGALLQLLNVPTQTGGSGCDVSEFEAGSKWMWGGLAGIVSAVIIASYLIYKNNVNTNEVISATNLYESDIVDLLAATKEIDEKGVEF